MKKRYRLFLSGAVCLALVTGILLGKSVFPVKESEKKKEGSQTAEETEKHREERVQTAAEAEEGVQTAAGSAEKEKAAGTMKIYDIEDGYMQVPFLPQLAAHNYDWKKLHKENGLQYYIEDSGAVSKLGIDVSYFQDNIDWAKVKASGIDFVMLRLGYRGYGESGALVVDEKFHQYIQEAQAAGLDTGVYFFSQAVNAEEAREEAEFVRRECSSYELACPVAFDTEKIKNDTARTDGLQPEELTDITIAFCEKIKEYGYTPMIYANAKWLTTKLELERLQDYKIWYADYQEVPGYPYWFDMWQYTETGQIDGIEGNVDLNVWFP